MATLSPRVTASAMRSAAACIAVSTCGSGIRRLMVGSRNASTASGSMLRPARMRASNSGRSWRCAIASARAAPRSSSRSCQARPVAEFSTPRKRRFSVISVVIPGRALGAIPESIITIDARIARYATLLELIELPVLGHDTPHGAARRAHHHGLGLDDAVAEPDAAQHAAVGDAGRREQAVAAHHVLDLILLARILDAHLGGALTLL